MLIVSFISYVDEVIDFEDDDMGSLLNALERLKECIQMMNLFLQMVATEITKYS